MLLIFILHMQGWYLQVGQL